MKQYSRWALLAMLPLSGLLVLSLPHTHRLTPEKPVRQNVLIRLKTGVRNMANVQILIGGAAVNVPVTTVGGGAPSLPGPASSNQFQVANQGTVLVPAQAFPASGASITANGLTLTNTGATTTLGSNTFPVLSIQALAAAAGVGYTLNETAPSSITNAFGLFDVVAGPPAVPAAPTTSNVTQTSVQVAIPTLAGGATFYNLQRAQDNAGSPGAWVTLQSAVTPAATYPDTSLSPVTGYYYRLQGVNTVGTTPGAATPIITTPAIVRTSSMARPSNLQSVYYSPEAPNAPGTIVLPAKRLPNFQLQTKPNIPNKAVKYPGSKATTAMQLGQEQSDSTYNAAADYNLLALILSSVLGKPAAPTALGGGAYQWTWNVSPTAPLPPPSTLSMDNGSARGGERFGYGVFSALQMKWSEQDAALSGNMFGQQVIRDIGPQMLVATNPAGVTEMPVAAIMPKSVGAWLSTDSGNNFNRMQKDLDGELRINNIWKPVYHVNDLNASYDDVAEQMPDLGLTLTVEEGSEADTFMSRLYAGQPVYAGFKTTGPVIANVGGININYLLKVNLPAFVSKPDPGDKSGVFGNAFSFDCAHDNVFGLIQVSLINVLGSL